MKLSAQEVVNRLQTAPVGEDLLVIFLLAASLTFLFLGSVASILDFPGFGNVGWLVAEVVLAFGALTGSFSGRDAVRWTLGCRDGNPSQEKGRSSLVFGGGIVAGGFLFGLWTTYVEHGEPASTAYKTFQSIALFCVAGIVAFLLQPTHYQITSSRRAAIRIPQTIASVKIDFPRDSDADTLDILRREPHGYRLAERDDYGYSHDLAKGSLYLVNRKLAIQPPSRLQTVHTTLFEVTPSLSRTPIPKNMVLSPDGVHSVIESLFIRDKEFANFGELVAEAIQDAIRGVVGDLGKKVLTMKSALNMRKLNDILRGATDEVVSTGVLQVSAVNAIALRVRAARGAEELLKEHLKTWTEVVQLQTSEFKKFKEQVREAFLDELTTKLISEGKLSPVDKETIAVMLDACGFRLGFEIQTSPTMKEASKLVEEVPDEWSEQVQTIYTEERNALKGILTGWLQEVGMPNLNMLATSARRPLLEVVTAAERALSRASVREMVSELGNLLEAQKESTERKSRSNRVAEENA